MNNAFSVLNGFDSLLLMYSLFSMVLVDLGSDVGRELRLFWLEMMGGITFSQIPAKRKKMLGDDGEDYFLPNPCPEGKNAWR